MHNLSEALNEIALAYPFTEKEYPELATYSKGQQKKFAIKHSILHIAKSLGKLATVSEHIDHGSELNRHSLQEATIKILVNTLRIAELQKLQEAEIYQEIPKVLRV